MLINNKEIFLQGCGDQRYSESIFPDQKFKSIDSPIKKGCLSAQKSVNTSQFRQTMQMKRYKYQKMAYQSKPLAIHNFYEQFFTGEQLRRDLFQSTNISQKIQNDCYSKMLPVTSSNWVSNSKKIQSKWLNGKRGISIDSKPRRQKPERKFEVEMNNEVVINDIKEYFYSMKLYLNNHKKKVERQRKIKVITKNQTKKQFEEKDNLSIIRLMPSEEKCIVDDGIGLKIEISPSQHSVSPQLIEHYSSQHIPSQSRRSRETSFSIKSQTAQRFKKVETTIFRKMALKQEQYHYIFGKIKDTMKEEQMQKLKQLYYRDFIWKIWYNRGFMYECPQQTYKYYVGKGNNSRLIRRIMNKRSWWVEESKPENAHFIWTQLKVYQIYKTQKVGLKVNKVAQTDSLLLTNAQDSESKSQRTTENHLKTQVQCQKGDKNSFILNRSNYKHWRNYIKSRGGIQRRVKENMKQRNLLPKIEILKQSHKVTNHLEFSRVIGNKKALYRTMQAYFNYKQTESYLPMTFHITEGLEDQEYLRFLREFYKKSKEGLNCWIVKPGQLSNRGKDIKYCRNLKEIKDSIKQKKTNSNGSLRTYIVQSYIQKPFLYQNRKFDLRHYLMVTSSQGQIKGYFYQQGYVRTTSYPYSLENHQSSVHLTNDAVQKYMPQYGKFQKANKLSYKQLNDYMLKINPKKGFYDCIFPQLKKIGTDIIHASFPFIDPQRRANNFQIFGIDVMIGSDCQCWLIQVNTNPCIQVNCSVLAAIIPQMLDNALAIGLDANICPVQGKIKLNLDNYLQSNKFELVFDEQLDGQKILSAYKHLSLDIGNFGDDDDNYQSCEQEDCES